MQEKSTVELLLANLAFSFFSPLLYLKRHYVVKLNGIEYVWQSWTRLMMFPDCFYYANMNQSLLLLFLYLRQSAILIGSASTRKYCIFRDGLTQETSGIFMQTVTKKNILMKMDFRFACPSHKQLQNVVRRVSWSSFDQKQTETVIFFQNILTSA